MSSTVQVFSSASTFVAEVGEQPGELLVDLPEPRLLRRIQLGAAPHEAVVYERRQPLLLGGERRRRQRRVDRGDAREQALVERDLVARGGELRLPLAVERLVSAATACSRS